MKCSRIVAAVAGLVLGLAAASAAAQAYPDKPIKIVVPVAPGGVTDVVTRVIGAQLTAAWGQPVVIDNRAGGSGIAAADLVAKSKPDGYTLFMGTIGTLTVNPSMFANLPYAPLRDFVAVSLVASAPTILVVNPAVPAKTVAELIAYAKAQPGRLNYASFGNATSPHLAGELFKSLAGVEMVHVPYKGGGPAMTDLLGGRVEVMFDNIITSMPHIKEGRLRPLAVTSLTRSKLMPDLPTMAEAGLPGQEVSGWVGLVAPAGTPPEVVAKLSREIARIVKNPEVQAKIVGTDVVGSTPEEFGAFMRAETRKWGQLVNKANIRAD
jgi:tripartite-type tricarboxylate transporter receptor subunit TctC